VPVAAWANRAEAFAAWWAPRPDLPCDPARWPDQAGMLRLLRDQLSSQLSPSSDRRAAAAGAVRRNFWRLLLEGAADPNQVLDAVVMTAAMAAAGETTRQALVQRVMGNAAGSAHPATAVARACQVLWAQRAPDAAEALTALKLIPARIPAAPMLTDAVQKALAAGWRQGDLADALDAVQLLKVHRLDIPEAWHERSQEDRRLQSLCAALAEPGGPQRDILKRLRGVDGAVAVARAREVARSLSRLDDPDVVAAALSEFPDPVGTELLRLVAHDYTQQPAPAVRWEFRLLTAKRLPPPLRRRLEDDLRRKLARGEQQLANSVSVLLARDGKALRADWDAWLAGGGTDPRGWARR